MFDEVTKREGGKRAARKGAYLFGSTAFQVAFIAALIFVSNKIKDRIADGPIVDVKFVKTAQAPPPPPPPPAPPKRKSSPKPPDSAPKPAAPPPTAMVQPKDVKDEIKLPDPNSKPEPEPDYGGGDGDGDEGGVEGGVAGGQAGSQAVEEAPQYATSGYKQPAMKTRGCVQEAVRIPRDLQGIVASVTVKFAIRPSGEPYNFSVLGSVPDQRIANAIWQAITSCEWTPGLDAQGKPVAIWVLLPLKFKS